MEKQTPFINILTYKLNYELARQIYNEYQSRLKEADYLIKNYQFYQSLKKSTKTVELLLALSIFHKRVIANLDAATKFYGIVNDKSNANSIKMGAYSLDVKEKNKILALTITYNVLMDKFSIPSSIMDYNETKDFLKKIINLKSDLAYAQKTKNRSTRKDENDPEIPF
jgi:hypothetical protein